MPLGFRGPVSGPVRYERGVELPRLQPRQQEVDDEEGDRVGGGGDGEGDEIVVVGVLQHARDELRKDHPGQRAGHAGQADDGTDGLFRHGIDH